MASKQTITWTALPNGFATQGGRLRLSVFVAPRLTTNPPVESTLAAFGDFQHWAEIAATVSAWSITFSNNPQQPVAGTRVGPAPRKDLWEALFPATTLVRPFKFRDFQNHEILSYPAQYLQQFIKNLYVKMATQSGTEHPDINDLIDGSGSFEDIAFYPAPRDGDPNRRSRLLTSLVNQLKQHKTIAPLNPTTSDDVARNFLQLNLFHKPPTKQPVKLPNLQDAIVARNLIDFHQALAALGDHAAVLRALGLVHDLEFPLPAGLPASGSVKVSATYTSQSQAQGVDVKSMSPWTRYELAPAAGKFLAAPRIGGSTPTDLSNGMLKLNNASAFAVVQVDLDGAAIKAMNFADTLLRSLSINHKSQDTPTKFAAPSLRTAGISLTRLGRATRLHEAVIGTATKNTSIQQGLGDALILDADDLVRGYRIDVQDVETGTWYSLSRRKATYAFGPTGGLKVESDPDKDEGQVSLGLTGPAGSTNGQVKLPESMALWQGWSLVAPRPGKTIGKDDQPEDVQNEPVTPFKLKTTVEAANNSLPPMRYGRRYRLRARAADLAGNSLPHTSTDASAATKEVTFGRFEPVPSPTLLFRTSPTTGETIDRLVIRNYGEAESNEMAERHVAPPKTSQLQAERHGLFDTAANGSLDKDRYLDIITRESGSFSNLDGKVDPTFDVPRVDVPYLPDPFARGAAFRFLPGMPINPSPAYSTLQTADFAPDSGQAWPNGRAFRVVAVPDPAQEPAPRTPPAWDGGARVLTVFVRKADDITARLSSYLREEDLNAMGLFHWIGEQNPGSLSEVRGQAKYGAHWMITPHRPLRLVYAVQRPLIAPKWTSLLVGRFRGETFARLSHNNNPTPHMPISGKSTSTLEVWGEWIEPQDIVSEPTPRWLQWNNAIEGKSKAFELTFKTTDTYAEIRDRWHEFGDTRHRMVRYSAVATTRFREYYADSTLDFTRGTPQEALVNVPSSARPPAPRVRYILPTFGWERSETQSVRRGNGLRIYLDRPWYTSGEGELLGIVLWTGGGQPSERLKPYVTQWGQDPLWSAPATNSLPTLASFKNPVATSTNNLSLDELGDQAPLVSVAGYEPKFDADRKLWYVDVEIDAGNAYYPFVRLALVRYQPSSIEHAHLSRVTMADFAQLTPDRVANVTSLSSNQVSVQVGGRSFQHTAGKTQGSTLAGPAAVEVTVEDEDPTVTDPELKWKPVSVAPGPYTLNPSAGPNGTTIWSGQVTRPANRRCRLVIREFEQLPADGVITLNNPSGVVISRRLVYAESMVIEPGVTA